MKFVPAITLLILLIIIGKFSLLTASFEPKDIGLAEFFYDVISVVVHLVLFFFAGLLLSVVISPIFSSHLTQSYLNLIIIMFGIVLAGGSEYLQIATSRDASLLDLGWNLLGFVLGIMSRHKLGRIRRENLKRYNFF